MISTSDLPAVNATLNAISTGLLSAGFVFVRRRDIVRHKFCMLSATCVSAFFLISYVAYHVLHGSTKFTHPGPIRWVYFAILISHVALAAAVVPLVLITLRRALRGQIDRHRAIARWTLPIWLYVSVTGVLVYLMLYQWNPAT